MKNSIKIVINKYEGCFGLSDECVDYMIARGFDSDSHASELEIARDDIHLINAVKALGSKKASGRYAELKIVEIPDSVLNWYISSYKGDETIHECHKTWR
jgi:hypothetical protein